MTTASRALNRLTTAMPVSTSAQRRLGPQETHADQRALPRHLPRAARRLPGR